MTRKNKDDLENHVIKGKKIKNPFHFLNETFDFIDAQTVKRHIFYLILASIVAKLIVIFVTTTVFHSFVDYFDIGIYLKHTAMLVQGQMPYDGEFGYPILIFIPLVIAFIPALIVQNAMAFVYSFQLIMVLCDIVTALCVYLIGLKIWEEKTAFYSGLIYTASFSAAYFVITKYDAFPTVLMMLGITFIVYGENLKGYAASVLGFFTKVFPIITLPYFILYNAKESSLKQEIIKAVGIGIPLSLLLFVPLFLAKQDTLNMYIPIRSELGFYSNTVTFTIYSWIHDVFKAGISIESISLFMYLVMFIGLLILAYIGYKAPKKDTRLLVKLLLSSVVLLVVCARVRSPQYIVWFTPLICILAADELKKTVSLFAFQTMAYIEFPLMFGAFYVANSYTNPVLSSGWVLTLLAFTLEYLALFVCLWLVIDPKGLYQKLQNGQSLY